MYEKFEDTKEVIRNGKLKKVRQYKGWFDCILVKILGKNT
jgi:hypothetical protein